MLMQVSAAVCDYQVEVNLISYNNSERRLQNGQCCDIKTNNTQQTVSCLEQDTCDVGFKFSVENLDTGTKFSNQSVVIGTYQDSNLITFDRCCTLINGVRNPLVFVIPSTSWSNGVSAWVELHSVITTNTITTSLIHRPIPSFSQWKDQAARGQGYSLSDCMPVLLLAS